MNVETTFAKYRLLVSWVMGLCFLTHLVFSRPSYRTDYHEWCKLLGLLLIILGTLGRGWCGLFISGRKNKELCQEGPYSLCRNPLYLFSFMGVMGIAMASYNLPLTLSLIPVFWVYYHYVIKAEEGNLRSLFGAAFDAYCAKIPKIIPVFNHYSAPEELTVKTRSLTKAMKDVFWFMLAILLVEGLNSLKGIRLHYRYFIPTLWHLPF